MNDKSTARKRKVVQGVVISNAMDKTVRVRIDRRYLHPVYKKYVTRKKVLMAHDERNECKVGDAVQLTECRPLSRKKRWRVTQIASKAV